MENFRKLGLNDNIIKAIEELGFVEPTPIQEKTIPAIITSQQDVVALAQTGTGKTAGFCLPIIQNIDENIKGVQAIILCPTRELCLQISNDLEKFIKHTKSVSHVAVYGGTNIETQIRSLKKGVQIVVGTPGRTLDLIRRKMLKITNIRWLVLDEADEMLNMGFRDDLDAILEGTPENKQTLLFSATMPQEVRQIAQNYMFEPVELETGTRNRGADNVNHQYYVVKASDRYLALKRLADIHPNIYGIVFCRTRRETKEVAEKLMEDGYNADALHGDLSQSQRDYVMQRFRVKNIQLLVATDVAARGIDVTDLTHIINYNLPDDNEVYIHRSGRTGRAGKSGVSIIICHSRETQRIKQLEKIVGKSFKHMQVPGGQEICEKRLYTLFDRIEKVVVDEEQIGPYLAAIYKKLAWLDRDELLKRMVSFEFNQFLDYYKDAKDLNVVHEPRQKEDRKKDKRQYNGKVKYTRFYINIGSKQKLNAASLIGLINESTRNRNIEIGKIDILRNFSFFELDNEFENQIIKGLNGKSFANVKLSVQPSKEKEPDRKNMGEKKEYGRKKKNGGKKKTKARFV